MRTLGALGKPKFMAISMKDLSRFFTPECVIKIDIAYKPLLDQCALEIYNVENVIQGYEYNPPQQEIKKSIEIKEIL